MVERVRATLTEQLNAYPQDTLLFVAHGGVFNALHQLCFGTVEETSDVFITLWNPDQAAAQESGEEQVNKGELFQRIKKSRQGGVNALAKYQFCPLTLAMVPVDDILYERALAERQYALAGDDWKKAVERHLTGNMDV
jgi:uncharacterized protein YlzI (FlbEa/FlbD family)